MVSPSLLTFWGGGVGADFDVSRYGLLRDTDAKTLIDYATSPTSDPWYSQWRGRLNESTESAKSLYLSNTPSSTSKSTPRIELGEQIELRFESYEGEEYRVRGFEGENLMQVAKRNDLPSILATCGGNCEVCYPPFLFLLTLPRERNELIKIRKYSVQLVMFISHLSLLPLLLQRQSE